MQASNPARKKLDGYLSTTRGNPGATPCRSCTNSSPSSRTMSTFFRGTADRAFDSCSVQKGCSPAPPTCEWQDRICSANVVPDRIAPTTNRGTPEELPLADHDAIVSRVKNSI